MPEVQAIIMLITNSHAYKIVNYLASEDISLGIIKIVYLIIP